MHMQGLILGCFSRVQLTNSKERDSTCTICEYVRRAFVIQSILICHQHDMPLVGYFDCELVSRACPYQRWQVMRYQFHTALACISTPYLRSVRP
jgi:hypothetical protein